MEENDKISLDRLRIQISNPCKGWNNSTDIELFDCNGSSFTIKANRANCNECKIIAWMDSSTDTFGQHAPIDGKSQVVCRIIGDCVGTESREFIDSRNFEYYREIPYNPSGSDYSGYTSNARTCRGTSLKIKRNFEVLGPTERTDCRDVGEPVYYQGFPTPDRDIKCNDENDCSKSQYPGRSGGTAGMSNAQGDDNFLFVEYGTEATKENDDISANCVTYNSSIYFIYIPPGHYSYSGESADNKPGYILDGAFSGLIHLRGIWIDEGDYFSGHFKYMGGHPFDGASELEIVYCPSDWVQYFRNADYFPNIKYINGEPYDDARTGYKHKLNTNCLPK